MYRNAYQRGMLTVFFSCGSNPTKIWDIYTQDGYVSKFLDQDIKSMVLDICGTNVSTTYMVCPKGSQVLGITMPFLVMIVKNLKKYFSFEVTILDETSTRRRFRVSNFQSTTQIMPMCTVMPIGLSEGWNQIQFNLAEFTRRAYQKQFIEVQKLKINANIRLRRIYFTERLIPEDELPPEYKLYFPLAPKSAKEKKVEQAKAAEVAAAPVEERKGSKAEVPKAGSKSSVRRASQQEVPAPKIEEVPEAQVVEAAPAEPEVPVQSEVPAESSEPAAEPGGEPAAEAIPEEAPSEPATSEPATSEPVTSEPATEGDATPVEAEAEAPPPEPTE